MMNTEVCAAIGLALYVPNDEVISVNESAKDIGYNTGLYIYLRSSKLTGCLSNELSI